MALYALGVVVFVEASPITSEGKGREKYLTIGTTIKIKRELVK